MSENVNKILEKFKTTPGINREKFRHLYKNWNNIYQYLWETSCWCWYWWWDALLGSACMNVKIDEMWPGLAWAGFNVWVLGDVRAQAVSQAACPDILEPTGAGSVVTITKYFLISTQFSQYLYQLATTLISPPNIGIIRPEGWYSEGREGGILNGSKTKSEDWRVQTSSSISDEREERVKHSSRLLPAQPVRCQKLKIFGNI